jgi:hypothetical protein
LSSPSVKTSLYRLAGLHIVSEVPLSGLVLHDVTPSEVVTIRHAHVAKALSSPIIVQNGIAYDGKALLLVIPAVARFLVREGSEILVDPEFSSNKNDIRAYLLGSAFGTPCYQLRIMPLHSAAVDIMDGCVAFIGHAAAMPALSKMDSRRAAT